MQQASFSGFITTLFYIVVFYYIFKFLAKLFLPLLLKKVAEKAGQNFQKQQHYSQGNTWQNNRDNDEVILDTTNAKKVRSTKKVGEYVDYEELN
jgi:hypothetical protein